LRIALGFSGAERALFVAEETREIVGVTAGKPSGNPDGISWAIITEVIKSRQPRVYSDALSAEELASHRSIAEFKLRSLACVPVIAGDEVLGALYIDHQGIAGLFTERHLPTLTVLAGVMAAALCIDRLEGAAGAVRRSLEETERHILRAERNRVAGEIASGLVHDFKNILTAVSGRAQLIRQYSADSRVTRSADAIDKAADTAIGVIHRLQECSKERAGQTEELADVGLIAREALELLSTRLEKHGIHGAVEADPGAVVMGRPGELRELFLNLVVNACDAMPDGGELRVRARVRSSEQVVEIEVRDTGCGMSADVIGRVFEPFFTTKGHHGTGLGLVVVQNTVACHGGRVEVCSAAGLGTTFTITLPLASASPHIEAKKGPSRRRGLL